MIRSDQPAIGSDHSDCPPVPALPRRLDGIVCVLEYKMALPSAVRTSPPAYRAVDPLDEQQGTEAAARNLVEDAVQRIELELLATQRHRLAPQPPTLPILDRRQEPVDWPGSTLWGTTQRET